VQYLFKEEGNGDACRQEVLLLHWPDCSGNAPIPEQECERKDEKDGTGTKRMVKRRRPKKRGFDTTKGNEAEEDCTRHYGGFDTPLRPKTT